MSIFNGKNYTMNKINDLKNYDWKYDFSYGDSVNEKEMMPETHYRHNDYSAFLSFHHGSFYIMLVDVNGSFFHKRYKSFREALVVYKLIIGKNKVKMMIGKNNIVL